MEDRDWVNVKLTQNGGTILKAFYPDNTTFDQEFAESFVKQNMNIPSSLLRDRKNFTVECWVRKGCFPLVFEVTL